MAYRRFTYHFENSIEYEYKFSGRVGAKGEKRAKRQKATPDQIKRQSERNKENKYRRLIKASVVPGDGWGTVK